MTNESHSHPGNQDCPLEDPSEGRHDDPNPGPLLRIQSADSSTFSASAVGYAEPPNDTTTVRIGSVLYNLQRSASPTDDQPRDPLQAVASSIEQCDSRVSYHRFPDETSISYRNHRFLPSRRSSQRPELEYPSLFHVLPKASRRRTLRAYIRAKTDPHRAALRSGDTCSSTSHGRTFPVARKLRRDSAHHLSTSMARESQIFHLVTFGYRRAYRPRLRRNGSSLELQFVSQFRPRKVPGCCTYARVLPTGGEGGGYGGGQESRCQIRTEASQKSNEESEANPISLLILLDWLALTACVRHGTRL